MSKRFGRNQKRKMREQIAAEHERADQIAAALAMNQGLSRELTRKLAEHSEFFRDVARIVGEQSIIAGVEPRQFAVRDMPRDHQRTVPIQPMPSLSLSMNASVGEMTFVRYEILRLLEVSAVRDVFSRSLHMRAMLADKSAGYQISETALAVMPRDMLERRIVPEMAHFLAKEIKGMKK